MFKKLQTFRRLNWHTKGLMLHTFILMGIVRLSILKVPFKKISPYIGEKNKESSYEMDPLSYQKAKEISDIVAIMSRHTPWESKCLVQAMVAQYMLKKAHIPTTLYLGVCKGAQGEMKAHAWLRYGSYIVTGAAARVGYKTISSFSNHSLMHYLKERSEGYEKVG